jgi:hypothetical protein
MLAQACMRRLTFPSNSGRLLFRSGPFRLAPGAGPLHASCIDDPLTFGVSEEEVNDTNDAVGSVCEKFGLPTEASKRRRALRDEGSAEALGLRLWRDGTVTPSHSLLAHLLKDTERSIHAARITPRAIAKVLGAWVSALLLCRPLLSMLSSCYCFIRSATDRR